MLLTRPSLRPPSDAFSIFKYQQAHPYQSVFSTMKACCKSICVSIFKINFYIFPLQHHKYKDICTHLCRDQYPVCNNCLFVFDKRQVLTHRTYESHKIHNSVCINTLSLNYARECRRNKNRFVFTRHQLNHFHEC